MAQLTEAAALPVGLVTEAQCMCDLVYGFLESTFAEEPGPDLGAVPYGTAVEVPGSSRIDHAQDRKRRCEPARCSKASPQPQVRWSRSVLV